MKKNRNTKSGFFYPRIFLAVAFCAMGSWLALLSFASPTTATSLNQAVVPTISPALRDLPTLDHLTTSATELGDTERTLAGRQTPNPLMQDTVVQSVAAAAAMPPVGANFEGMNISQGCGGCLPPDTNGAVGPNHYVQMVNTKMAVFNKTTGAIISGPKAISGLWTSGQCHAGDDGDPIVIYDQLADRWLVSQFVASSPYAECIAVSTSPDPSGTYYAYEFDQSTTVFHDYPHIGVWPDAYYMSSNEFPEGSETNSGAGAFAFERAKMLAGQPARFIWFDESAIALGGYVPGGQNPTNLEGRALPPAGAPNYFVEMDIPPLTPDPTVTTAVMAMWKFHVDWNNPANSTFGTGSTTPTAVGGGLYTASGGHPDFLIPVANFVPAQCVYGQGPNCVPEKIVAGIHAATLDTLGDRVMFRATYRNFGNHESLVVHHTVVTAADVPTGGTRTGLRWYEVRNLSTTPTIYQQSTFAPLDPTNPLWRFMGSAAMDHSGDIAIGYTASGPNYYPSLHYAGRLATDPVNDLTQGEAVMFAGLGIQGYPLNRWGDYSDLTVDPTDDCTFWYTNEYLPTNPIPDLIPVNWHTRIGSFKFPQCVSPSLPPLTSVVSRKVHGTLVPPADLPLNLTGTRTIECRAGGIPTGNHTLIFTFTNSLAGVSNCTATATTSSGTQNVSCNGSTLGGPGYDADLSGVPNASHVTVTLHSVTDVLGNAGDVSVNFDVLLGDVNATGRTDAGDVTQVRNRTVTIPNTTDPASFRYDVNASGRIDAGDVTTTRNATVTVLP